MKNQTVVIIGIVVVVLAGAFFVLKPEPQQGVHTPVVDESQPHDH